jgi:hypothetical protein
MISNAARATLAIAAISFGCLAGNTFANDRDTRTEIGFAIAEQQGITLDHDNPAQGLGSYLVNSAGCNDCHTWPNYAPGGDPYSRQPKQVPLANYLAGGRLFALPTENVCSRNLTPSPDNGYPAGLSHADFLYVIKTGCDPQDDNFRDPQTCGLLLVMPWPNYQDMKRQEISAMYSYLSALPHATTISPIAPGGCTPDNQGVAGE